MSWHPKKKILVLVVIVGVIGFLAKCISAVRSEDPRGKVYAGAAACRQCHQVIYDSFIKTAHYNASSPAGSPGMAGHFTNGKNTFAYDSGSKVKMEKRRKRYLMF